MDRLEQMLRAQRELQTRLGHKYEAMTTEERIAEMTIMALAVVSEVNEALNEITWKPWAKGEPTINRRGVLSELNDVWQFIANMWFLAMPEATPGEIADAMHWALDEKLRINHTRIDDGYDGTNKCPGCRRAYDDTYVTCIAVVPQTIAQEEVPAFCDVSQTYVSGTGDVMALGATGWYVVTP